MTAGPDASAKPAAPAPATEPEPEQAAPSAASATVPAAPAAAQKSPHAFRTITEAAQALDLPQHVLRFWETRFPGLRPLKRAGGRRYYRPEDMALLHRIRELLHGKGYTIKGAQKLLASGAAAQNGGDESAAAPPPASASAAAAGAAPDPAAERLRREAALLLDELKNIHTALKT